MPRVTDVYTAPPELTLGKQLNKRVPEADQNRQRIEVEEILRRLRTQPGVILADEVGMGKTFVALAVAYGIAVQSPKGPVIVMVPPNLVGKWEKDLKTFCDLYVPDRILLRRGSSKNEKVNRSKYFQYDIARHSVELLKLLDDPPRERCQLILLAQGAMSRSQSDKWVRLALIAEALRRHGVGKASRLIQVKKQIHRFLGKLLWAIGEERSHGWGEKLWKRLLDTYPAAWKDTYNQAVRNEEMCLKDDPVPKQVVRALEKVDLRSLAAALKEMPVRARGGDARVSERLDAVRRALTQVVEELWKSLLALASWRSPLLVMDEAHHLKNPATALARQLQSLDLTQDLRTGDGAMAKAFDRMLFLTATPFQLGHFELVQVLRRFGDVKWDAQELGEPEAFQHKLSELGKHLDESQRCGIALQRAWSRLRPEDVEEELEAWWIHTLGSPRELLMNFPRAVVDTYERAKRSRELAEGALRPWIVRHNKGLYWEDTNIVRRCRKDGEAAANGKESARGLPVPEDQLLPFFLAARSAVTPGKDLLGEALSSSYEAFRDTRRGHSLAKDEQYNIPTRTGDLTCGPWYLGQFDRSLDHMGGSIHPKVCATVKRATDLWEAGEKVLVFAFYRHTCRALRKHISKEIERRITQKAEQRLRQAGRTVDDSTVDRLLQSIQRRFFDQKDSPGRQAVDRALEILLNTHFESVESTQLSPDERDMLTDVMRRFLRASTTLVCCFPIAEVDKITPDQAVAKALDYFDGSGLTWRRKFDIFVDFLVTQCSPAERRDFLDAAQSVQTGRIRVEDDEEAYSDEQKSILTVPNVQAATGETKRDSRSRLMLAFNTPFFPDILVCSEVMGEGVDLQRFCRHVIHHDLDWNPSQIEQRTGRIDRLGCKAEGRYSIEVYLQYLAGAADERQYRVMSDREQWFRIVMGQEQVARLITPDSLSTFRLPDALAAELSFKLGLSAE
jgi:superfamily II DNA or RNA helicase